MFEFHNLGALAVGAVLIGIFQLGGHTGLILEPEPRMDSAKFVTVQGRHATSPTMNSLRGLDQFASEKEAEASVFEKAMVVFDQASGKALEMTRSAVDVLVN